MSIYLSIVLALLTFFAILLFFCALADPIMRKAMAGLLEVAVFIAAFCFLVYAFTHR